jgi:uncharacterized membrane protein YGL010W
MNSYRDLLVANLLALAIVIGALLVGWRDAAAFGLAVLVVLDLFVWLRARLVRSEAAQEPQEDEGNDP